MVTINYETSPKRRTFRLSIKGHAGQAEVGKDLVCACVSILTYTAAYNVEFLSDIKAYTKPPRIDINEGDSTIECEVADISTYKTLANRLDAIVTGFRLLQASYPKNVTCYFNGKAFEPK